LGLSAMGSEGMITINSGRLLATCWMVTLCRALLVITTVAPVPVVFTVTEPKLSAVGVTPTPALAGTGDKIQPIKKIPTKRHTSRV
jgi:hypothetical protein